MKTEFDFLIEELQNEIKSLKEELIDCIDLQDYKYAHFYQNGIWRVQREIEKLQSLNEDPFKLETQHLYDSIIELLDKRIKSFSIIFPNLDFYFHFSVLVNGHLYCEIPPKKEMQKANNYYYDSKSRDHIIALGFQFDSEKLGIEFIPSLDHSHNYILVKLAVLMFDILNFPKDIKGYISKDMD